MSELRFLTTDELAELLRVPTQTVRQWRYKGTGPRGHRVGKRVLYDVADVERWLAECADDSPAA